MTSRSTLPLVVLVVAACSPQQGRVRISVLFENETRTECIKAVAKNTAGNSVNANPDFLTRAGKDTLVIGLAETAELTGEVKVTVSRFTSADCKGTAFASETKSTTLVHRGAGVLEFSFSDPVADGGLDGGVDAGTDGGASCNTAACGNTPGECERLPATGCSGDGGCRFTFKNAQSTCPAGVCNATGTCIANVCAVLNSGTPCDDSLPCTPSSNCMNGNCQGSCPVPPQCTLPIAPIACDPMTPTTCSLRPFNDFGSCTLAPGGQCFDGGCLTWLRFTPINFTNTFANTPYPTAAWNLSSADGGVCDTIISTSGATPTVLQGDCGSPVITSTINDAGASVITALGLDVGPNARLHFVGARPVQLVVLGNANIHGIVTVAPLLRDEQPAGTNDAGCNAGAGLANRKAGGGGGFGDVGGNGGEAGGVGGSRGTVAGSATLRAGCPGAVGFRPTGTTPGGTAGGALQLIVADSLTMMGGVVTASGGGGAQGTTDNEGGGGGGSGGTIIIEAWTIDLDGGAVTANGGGGGEGGDMNAQSLPGALGPIQSATALPGADGPGAGGVGGVGGDNNTHNGGVGGNTTMSRGGGGGGGSVGVIFLRSLNGPCLRGTGVISGAQPMTFTCN